MMPEKFCLHGSGINSELVAYRGNMVPEAVSKNKAGYGYHHG